jgi:hypothetical protein
MEQDNFPKSNLNCNDTLAVIAVKNNMPLLLQESTRSQELVLQAFVEQQKKNGHLFRHEKVLIHPTNY